MPDYTPINPACVNADGFEPSADAMHPAVIGCQALLRILYTFAADSFDEVVYEFIDEG
ncbi:MAG: hypothetical protein ACK5SX_14975 [Sandaracinobacter sp.]